MNKFFTLGIILGCTLNAKSQKNSLEMTEINPHPIAYNKKLSFAHIDVIDSRYDTTKIGYVLKGNKPRKLTVGPFFSAGIQNSLNTSLHPNFDLSKNASLVIIIKNFWLRDAIIKKQTEFGSQCVVKLELYLKVDTAYFPLVRIDTIFTHDEALKDGRSELVMLPFEHSLIRLEKIDLQKAITARKLSWKEIEEFNEKRFQKSIYSASPQRGIYLSFKDFLENRLDARPFEINFGKLTDQLYLTGAKEKTVLTEFWAVCDGNKLYINRGLNFYELTRTDKGFEFWGDPEIANHSPQTTFQSPNTSPESMATGLATYGTENLMNSKKNLIRPFEVNMDNGTIY